MDAFVNEFAKQGLGYVIAVILGFVIVALTKELNRVNEKRVVEIEKYATIYTTTSKDLLTAIALQTQSLETQNQSQQTILQLLNEIKARADRK